MGQSFPSALRVLLVEDNLADAVLVEETFAGADDFAVEHCVRLGEALRRIAEDPFDCVLLDLTLPDSRGLEGIHSVLAVAPSTAVVVISGSRDVTMAVQAVRDGAQDYLLKGDADLETLRVAIRGAVRRRRAAVELAERADTDPLTGLFNRRRFDEELEVAVGLARRHGEHAAVLVLDLDRFKSVNDTWGHAAGDDLIVRVADVLRARLRTTDSIGRPGGDEFCVLLRRCGAGDARTVAEDLLRDLADAAEPRLATAASIGVCLVGNGEERSGTDVLQAADHAMYEAKRAGGARVALAAAPLRAA